MTNRQQELIPTMVQVSYMAPGLGREQRTLPMADANELIERLRRAGGVWTSKVLKT
ncbi:hypothetical protein ACIGCH_16105 [Pseudomonas helleri]|uniref:hypothetical protein n=1 Tax=Pseudomonas helleri TaxID=1608996 RepID=UPI0037CB574C